LAEEQRPKFMKLGYMKATKFTSAGCEKYWEAGQYLPFKFLKQVPEEDHPYFDDSMTVRSFLNLMDLMDKLKPCDQGAPVSELEKVTDPHLMLLTQDQPKFYDKVWDEKLTKEFFMKIPGSMRKRVKGDHFDAVIPSHPAH